MSLRSDDVLATGLRPLVGGYSGETFVAGPPNEQVVVRIYHRNPTRCPIDAALLRLVSGIVPVPDVLEVRPKDGDQPAVLVTGLVRGTRLDTLLPTMSPADLTAVGRNLGRILGRLSGMPQPRFGFFDGPDLVPKAPDGPPFDLTDWAHSFRETGRFASWSDADWNALLALVDAAECASEEHDRDPRTVLVHSDMNAKNVLVDAGTCEVTALLDWEFAHAGSPYTDLGNALRFERQPGFGAALLEGLVATAPPLANEAMTLARYADLWALIELANRPTESSVRAAATELLLEQARSGDINAWPWRAPRFDLLGSD